MQPDDIAISLSHLSKSFRLFGHTGDRIKQFLSLGMKQYHREFTAVQGVSIDIKRGEAIGIIGRNGSGKSTLLQLICGILKPTSGALRINGRVSALLELGTGFNPEFTGRENVYFQGAIMGLTQDQMDECFDTIADFAELGDFLDQPVRSYSSGMYMRLAFSVAIHVDPDILVVDEALSVGDVVFQHKSMQRARELVNRGTTLLLVSHDRNMIISACNRCLLIDKGRLIMDGQPADVFDYYLALNTKGNEGTQLKRLESGRLEVKSGSGEAGIENIRLLDNFGNEIDNLEVGMSVALEFKVRIHQFLPKLNLVFSIRDRLGQNIFTTNTSSFNKTQETLIAGTTLIYRYCFDADFGPGSYSISTFLISSNNRHTDNFETRELVYFFEVKNVSMPPFTGSFWLNPTLEVQNYPALP